MFKRLRIAVLLYVLLFVAPAQFFTARHTRRTGTRRCGSTSMPSRATASPPRGAIIDGLSATEFADAEAFLAREAKRYGVALEQPFKLRIVGEHARRAAAARRRRRPPRRPVVELAHALARYAPAVAERGPSGDIVVFAVFHEPTDGVALDRSTALDKGLIAVANLFADRDARATNQIVLAHELLHTLRATDKYSSTSNAPSLPRRLRGTGRAAAAAADESGAHGGPHTARRAARRDADRSCARSSSAQPRHARSVGRLAVTP